MKSEQPGRVGTYMGSRGNVIAGLLLIPPRPLDLVNPDKYIEAVFPKITIVYARLYCIYIYFLEPLL